jgi:hypothetical protein
MRMMSTIKKVNIKGPTKDFNTNVSTFFTSSFHLRCKNTSFLSENVFIAMPFFDAGFTAFRLSGPL